MEFFFPSHWHTQRWTIPPVDKSCVCCQQTLSLRGCDLQPHTHPTGSLRVPQCSVRWKAHVPTSPLNDRAADHFKQNFPSVGGGMLKSLSRYPGELFGTLSTCVCVCVCKCNVFYCVYSLWVHVYARTDLCCQVPPHKCVCVCVPQYTCQLWSFFAQPCGTQQMCSALPRGSLLRSLPLSSLLSLSSSPFIRTYPPMFIRHCSSDNKLTSLLIPLPSFGYIFTPPFSLCTLQNMLRLGISLSWTCPN